MLNYNRFHVNCYLKATCNILFCKSIIFNNLLKVCYSNKKYLITIKTHQTQIVISIFLIEKLGFRNSTPKHKNFLQIISYYTFDPNKKLYENSFYVLRKSYNIRISLNLPKFIKLYKSTGAKSSFIHSLIFISNINLL